ncbi:MAG: Glu-tRNA(Gln) amidotransferase subunit GatD [Candidatus Bilamarchaeaceae archaeon]
MYSDNIEKTLKKIGAEIGDEVEIKKEGKGYFGILMPRTQGDPDTLVIKLENGYNIGISFEGCEVRLIKKGEMKKTEEKGSEEKGEISIIGCGGTISSKIEYKTGAVYPVISPGELLATFPQISNIAKIKVRKLFSLLSEDMAHEHWAILAKNVADEIKEGAKGVVVMHGTDTMGYTAAALSFMLQNLPVPVVLVGAQRSSDRPSSDNELNLLNSIWVAKKSDVAEVTVCMHATQDDSYCYLHRGTRVRKFHNSRRDAFKSVNSLPIAAVDYRKNLFEKINDYQKRDEKRKIELDTKINNNVAMVYVHPGIKPSLIDSLSKYEGVVMIGTGLGHLPTNPFNDAHAHSIYKNVKELIASGVAVVMASQTIYGRINMNVYSTGRLLKEAGVIGDGADWTPETAFVKLCWVLGHEKKLEKVKELMMKNIAGELSERSPVQKVPEI